MTPDGRSNPAFALVGGRARSILLEPREHLSHELVDGLQGVHAEVGLDPGRVRASSALDVVPCGLSEHRSDRALSRLEPCAVNVLVWTRALDDAQGRCVVSRDVTPCVLARLLGVHGVHDRSLPELVTVRHDSVTGGMIAAGHRECDVFEGECAGWRVFHLAFE